MADETKTVDHNTTCEELRQAIAQQQEVLSEMERAPLAMAGGATLGGDLLPGSTANSPNNTVIESEIQRLQQALRDNGCE